MRTVTSAAAALLARIAAGEKIPTPLLLYLGTGVPNRWVIGGAAVTWGGYTWTPADIDIDVPAAERGVSGGLQFTIAGVSDSQRALAFVDVEGAYVDLYVALVDPTTLVVEDTIQIFAGFADVPGWQDGARAVVQFTAESDGAIALRPTPSRYTNAEQQRLYPGDLSLDFDPATDAGPIIWPAASWGRQ